MGIVGTVNVSRREGEEYEGEVTGGEWGNQGAHVMCAPHLITRKGRRREKEECEREKHRTLAFMKKRQARATVRENFPSTQTRCHAYALCHT